MVGEMADFGTLKTMSLRELWNHEASSFTPWLARNVNELGDALGMELELSDSEAPVGEFSLDLLAKDLGSGGNVIIENQLTKTDHDHLGKLVTYGAGFGAEKVIWVAESVREEHRQALEWLNQRTDEETQFFAVVIEALQIDDSRPAFHFKVVASPNEWQKATKRKQLTSNSKKAERYREFYQRLIDDLRENYRFTSARAGQPQNWYAFASGHSGVRYGLVFGAGSRIRAEVYIDLGDGAKNQALFETLKASREDIEKEFGEELAWEPLGDKRASRIAAYRMGSIEEEDEALAAIHSWAVEKLLKIRDVFGGRLREALAQLPSSLPNPSL